MNATVFCTSCGTQLVAQAKFCTSCGAPQEVHETLGAGGADTTPGAEKAGPTVTGPVAAEAAETVPLQTPPAAGGRAGGGPRGGQARSHRERIEQVSPSAGEFADQLAAQLSTPGVAVALITAGVAASVCLALGIVLAVALPDTSLLSFELRGDVGTLTEAFGQFLSLLLVSFGFDQVAAPGRETFHIGATSLLAAPIGAAAVAAAAQAHRTRGLPAWMRLAWASAAGVPFTLAVVVAAVVASDLDPAVGSAILLGILWVGLGGAIGTAVALRREGVDLAALLPARSLPPLRTAGVGLRPLALVLVAAAVIGVGVAFVQTVRDNAGALYASSTATALVDRGLLAVDIGVNYAALSAGVEFRDGFALPIPVDDPIELIDASRFDEGGSGGYRLFDFGSAMAPYVFVPLLLTLMGLVVLAALYAGFSIARTAGAATPATAAGFGALVGPLWSIVAVLANAMHVKVLGAPDGESVFVMFLLGGALLGALGGLLSNSAARPAQTPS